MIQVFHDMITKGQFRVNVTGDLAVLLLPT